MKCNDMVPYRSARHLAGAVALNVYDWPGPQPTVVFLHGFTGSGLAALPLAKLLNGQQRLLAPDLRGRGNSDVPAGRYGITVHANDVHSLLIRLSITKYCLVGYSYGAAISVFLAAAYPEYVSRLVLIDGGVVPSPIAADALDTYYDAMRYQYPSIDTYLARLHSMPNVQPFTDEVEQLARTNVMEQPDGTLVRRTPRYVVEADGRRSNLKTWATLPEQYARIHCPVLMIRAVSGLNSASEIMVTDDDIMTMRNCLPQLQVVTVPGSTHSNILHIASPERDTSLLEFLN